MRQSYDKLMLRINFQRWVICLTLLVGYSSLSSLQAQTFTQRIQQTPFGGATLKIHHAKAIDELVNEGSSPAVEAVKKRYAEKAEAERKSAAKVTTSHGASHPETIPDTLARKAVRTFKTTGYRVQVFAGGNSRIDKQTAERIGNELHVLFPAEAIYVHFKSPRWLCRLGNYRTQEEAIQMLNEVKKLGYTAATIVKSKITLQY